MSCRVNILLSLLITTTNRHSGCWRIAYTATHYTYTRTFRFEIHSLGFVHVNCDSGLHGFTTETCQRVVLLPICHANQSLLHKIWGETHRDNNSTQSQSHFHSRRHFRFCRIRWANWHILFNASPISSASNASTSSLWNAVFSFDLNMSVSTSFRHSWQLRVCTVCVSLSVVIVDDDDDKWNLSNIRTTCDNKKRFDFLRILCLSFVCNSSSSTRCLPGSIPCECVGVLKVHVTWITDVTQYLTTVGVTRFVCRHGFGYGTQTRAHPYTHTPTNRHRQRTQTDSDCDAA